MVKETLAMPDELEPCPMCGGDASAEGVVQYFPSYEACWADGTRIEEAYFANCCACQLRTHTYQTKAEAIAAWNRRAAPAPMNDDALVALCRKIPLHGDAGCDKLTDDEWRAVLSTVRPTIEAAAREDERARVVTMFRERAEMRQHDDARSIFLFWADAIERGEHRENGDG